MKTNSLFKRLVSMLIVVLMICTLFPVTALADPAEPTYEVLKSLLEVEIDCETEENDEDIHDEIIYELLDNIEGLKPSFSVGEVKDKSCTVTVFSDRYIDKYNEDTTVIHSPEKNKDKDKDKNKSKTVTLKYENNKWELDGKFDDENGNKIPEIEFDVVCNGIPTPPTKPGDDTVKGLLANSTVTIDCTSDSSHTDGNYPLATGTYEISNVQGDAVNGYTCDITVDPTTYIAKYNETFKGHTLDPEVQSRKIILEYVVASGWQVKEGNSSVTFTVKCKDEPEEVTYTLKYNANDGSTEPFRTDSKTNRDGKATFTIITDEPTRVGYTFKGWSTSSSGAVEYKKDGEFKNTFETTQKDNTLYAVWEENQPEEVTYTLKYNANDGSTEPFRTDSKTNRDGKATFTIITDEPTRVGYTFKGWSTSSSGAVEYKKDGEFKNTFETTQKDNVLYAVWKENPPTPQPPSGTNLPRDLWINAVKIDCNNTNASHEDKTYGLLADSYQIGEVTAVATGGYTCEITVEPALYVAAYKAYIGVDHELNPATQSAKKITLTYVATSGKWQVNQGSAPVTFTVKCVTPDPAPKQPVATDLPEILWKEAVKIHCSVKTSHADATYGLLEDSYQIGEVTGNATEGYECTVTVNSAKYIEEYNKTNAGHKAVATDPSSRTITLKYTGSAWAVKSGSAPVVFYVECETSAPAPKQPVATDLPEILWKEAVKIHCSVKTSHADATYGLLEGSYQIGEVTGNATEGYECTVTVNSAKYIEEYNKTNAGHKAVATDPSSRTITLKYTGSAWAVKSGSAPVVFYVECESPAPTTYTVTYKDGVGGKVFKDDVHTVESGATTPAFVGGIPTRPGYVFVGWTPAVSRCVTGDATYTATWRKVKDTTVIEIGGGNSSSSSKEENPNTGAPVFVGVSVGALAAAK